MNIIESAETLKQQIDRLKEQYSEAGWDAEAILWEHFTRLRVEDCTGTADYIVQFRANVQRMSNIDLKIDDKLLVYQLMAGLGPEQAVWAATM